MTQKTEKKTEKNFNIIFFFWFELSVLSNISHFTSSNHAWMRWLQVSDLKSGIAELKKRTTSCWKINVTISNTHVEAATFTEFGHLEHATKRKKSHHSKSSIETLLNASLWISRSDRSDPNRHFQHRTWKPPWPSKTPKRPTLDQPLSTVDVSDLGSRRIFTAIHCTPHRKSIPSH